MVAVVDSARFDFGDPRQIGAELTEPAFFLCVELKDVCAIWGRGEGGDLLF